MSDGATLDIKACNLVIGTHRISGWADGDWLSWVFNVEQFTEHVGADGEGYWIVNPNLSARWTASLLPSSASNSVLSRLWQADIRTPGGLMFPCTFVDRANPETVLGSARARVLKLPDATWSTGPTVRQWLFGTTRLEAFIGGMPVTPLNPDA